ncbi:RDD family protein [Dinghuibacter silviterrae]|uniref:Putative RDD family membrane protein YckC n=1 Tax=Dinghuibacter silviterrae TaxID=1539049 RepID=A0A4R8DEE8_9BACT|nr:RDD family protein [Dinghuibacter silviterrae]TDW95805.1 putative RDD family membrane protein YckC [Dinghuibacter silviterrae]
MPNKSLGKRSLATLLDYLVVYAFTYFYILAFGERAPNGTHVIHNSALLIPTAFWFIFIVLTEQYLGGTVGHQLFGLRVITADKHSLWLGRTLARRACDAIEISWCFGLIAYIIAQTSEKGQRLGDMVARTTVVAKKDLNVTIQFEFEQTGA